MVHVNTVTRVAVVAVAYLVVDRIWLRSYLHAMDVLLASGNKVNKMLVLQGIRGDASKL